MHGPGLKDTDGGVRGDPWCPVLGALGWRDGGQAGQRGSLRTPWSLCVGMPTRGGLEAGGASMGAWPGVVTKGDTFGLRWVPTPAGCWHHEWWEPWQGVAEPLELPPHGCGGRAAPRALLPVPESLNPPPLGSLPWPPPFCLPNAG